MLDRAGLFRAAMMTGGILVGAMTWYIFLVLTLGIYVMVQVQLPIPVQDDAVILSSMVVGLFLFAWTALKSAEMIGNILSPLLEVKGDPLAQGMN